MAMMFSVTFAAVPPFLPGWTVPSQTVSQNKPSSLELHFSGVLCDKNHTGTLPAGAGVQGSWALTPPAQAHHCSSLLLCWALCQHILGTGPLLPLGFCTVSPSAGTPSPTPTTVTFWLKVTLPHLCG